MSVRRRYEGALRKFGQNQHRNDRLSGIAGDPLRQVDGLIVTCVQSDQNPAGRRADVLDGMAIALRNVGDVAVTQCHDPITAVRAEHRAVKVTGDDVLPFVGVRVLAHLAQAARLQIENDVRDGLGNRETIGADALLAPELVIECSSCASSRYWCVTRDVQN